MILCVCFLSPFHCDEVTQDVLRALEWQMHLRVMNKIWKATKSPLSIFCHSITFYILSILLQVYSIFTSYTLLIKGSSLTW